MRALIRPDSAVGGTVRVPGDKSIAHRWLILAATARGPSEIHDPPVALDVRSTARCLSALVHEARDALDAWLLEPAGAAQPDGFTFNMGEPRPGSSILALRTQGRAAVQVGSGELDCGNSGTTMRLLAGVLASCRWPAVLTGDESLRSRPMERVAEPLRAMGARVRTEGGHPPIRIKGGPLHGIRFAPPVPSAQVKGAVLLAGLAAEGETVVTEPAPTRDHTERALAHLGAHVVVDPDGSVRLRPFQHEGFEATVPGDVSSAAFLVGAAALTGAELTIHGVGLNPSRTRYLEVMTRMGVRVDRKVEGGELGEPVGDLHVGPSGDLGGVTVAASELPLIIDEVPVLAALAAHARGESRFLAAGELRFKESDRLSGLEGAIRSLGGEAAVQGEDLVLGGGGLAGGSADARGDHRMAMAMCVGALAARSPVEIEGVESADVSFPGFLPSLRALGASIEAEGLGR
jgi:3-phosphoshikimate 1-carboxyvinyltransferase